MWKIILRALIEIVVWILLAPIKLLYAVFWLIPGSVCLICIKVVSMKECLDLIKEGMLDQLRIELHWIKTGKILHDGCLERYLNEKL